MSNANGKFRTWISAAKENLFAYGRTFAVVWKSGSFALLGMVLITLSLGVLPAGEFFVTEHLVNAITDAVGDANWWQQVIPWLIGLLGLRIFSTLADQLRQPLHIHVRENIEVWLNERILEKADTTELIEFQTSKFQNALQRARSVSGLDLENILWWLIDSLQQLISVATLGIVLWRYHPLLSLLPAFTGIISWWSGSRFAVDIYNFDVEQTPQLREKDALEGILTDRATGKEVRLYQTQDLWINRWKQLSETLIHGQQKIERRKFFALLTIDILRGLLYAGSLILLLLEVFRGGLTVGTYIAAAAALVQLDGIWNEVAGYFQLISGEMHRLYGDLYSFLGRDTATAKKQFRKTDDSDADNTIQDIVIEHISFFYPNTQEPTLNDITLTLKKGERVAIVGPNGAGKTTLARLLLGLYRPRTGTIHIGDVPLNEENRQAWLMQCSAVFQDFTQYHLTARENIIFGDLEHPERMETASVAGGAASVVVLSKSCSAALLDSHCLSGASAS